MANTSQTLALKLTLLSLCLQVVLTQKLPPNGCSSLFQYQRFGDHWIGLATPPQDGLKTVNWKLQFMARGADLPGTTGSLNPYPDKETAFKKMHDGGRAQVYVQFLGAWDELPKIVLIELNGQQLCSDSGYGAPSSTSTRELSMSVSSTSSSVSKEYIPQTQVTSFTSTLVPTMQHQLPSRFNFGGNPFLMSLTSKKPVVIVDSQTRTDPASDECGVEGLVGLIHGGVEIPRGRFPWLAALYEESKVDPTRVLYSCVTTLISARTVITAAHCVYGRKPDQLAVYVGRHDTFVHPEENANLMTVESVRTHPDYVGNLVPDPDVALLVLTNQVRFTTYVKPICLWTTSTHLGIDDSEETVVAGWGNNGNVKVTQFPSAVNVRAVSREECLRKMVTARDFLTPRTLCAGNSDGHGPCFGDSGAGLMVRRNGRWFVRAIVSVAQRTNKGCDLSEFVIYCDVALHLKWIERNIVR